MLAKRVIPCLDVHGGRVVKGVRFVELRDAGDPVEAARAYDAQGADELVFLDITASHEGRATMLDVVRRTAEGVYMPVTVGGGVGSLDDVRTLLRAGADKVSLNTAALARPELIREAARAFGSQCIVVAIDAKRVVVRSEPKASGAHMEMPWNRPAAEASGAHMEMPWNRPAAEASGADMEAPRNRPAAEASGAHMEMPRNRPAAEASGADMEAPRNRPPAEASGADTEMPRNRPAAEASGAHMETQWKQPPPEGPGAEPPRWGVYTHGGRRAAGRDALEWARQVEALGAGEILLTSMDRDGTGAGYDLELTRAVSEAVGIPVIASGGAGTLAHLADGVTEGKADAVLVASIFHFGQHTVGEAKRYLRERGVPVRIDA